MVKKRTHITLTLTLIIAIFALSTSSIIIRVAQGGGASSISIAALRLAFATLMVAPIALTKHFQEIKNFSRREILLGALSGCFLAVHFASWISSLEFTSVASSAVFVSTGPLWVALLSPVLLNEHQTRAAVIGLGLSLLGGAIIGLSDACTWNYGLSCPNASIFSQGGAMWGNFLALAGAWAVTGYLIIGRKVRSGMSLIPYIFLVYGMAAVALTIMMFVSGNTPFGYDRKIYGWIFLLAALPQLIGHTTFNWALKYLPAAFVAVATLWEPVGAAILAFLILKETPSILVITGGLLILAGIFLASRQNQ